LNNPKVLPWHRAVFVETEKKDLENGP